MERKVADTYSRRSILQGSVGLAMGLVAPDEHIKVEEPNFTDIPQSINRIRKLSEKSGPAPVQDILDTMGKVMQDLGVSYESLREPTFPFDMVSASAYLPLGNHQIQIIHNYMLNDGDIPFAEATIRFIDDPSLPNSDIWVKFDNEDEDMGRANGGVLCDIVDYNSMTLTEEDDFLQALENAGFNSYDWRVCLKAVDEAIAHSNQSTYWEDEVEGMLEVENMKDFSNRWFNQIRGIEDSESESIGAENQIVEIEGSLRNIFSSPHTRNDVLRATGQLLIDRMSSRGLVFLSENLLSLGDRTEATYPMLDILIIDELEPNETPDLLPIADGVSPLGDEKE